MSSMSTISGDLLSILQSFGSGFTTFVSITLASVAVLIFRRWREVKVEGILPPMVPYRIPFIGHLKGISENPHAFVLDCYKKYGPVFSVKVFGKTITFLVGNEATHTFFGAKNEELNSAEIWGKVTTPMFGKDILFDVPHSVFLEQKKILKMGQTLKEYVPMIQKEAKQHFGSWGESGAVDICESVKSLVVYSIAHCLSGPEIRELLNDDSMKLLTELERGLSSAVLVVPSWFPLPCIRARDKAYNEIMKSYKSGIQKRRRNPNPPADMLQSIIDAEFRSGHKLNDAEVAGLCLSLQVVGRHTTAVSTTWFVFFLAQHKNHQDALYEEQIRICSDEEALTYDHIRTMTKLDCCFKETLRLTSPIRSLIRMALTSKTICGYTIPKGHWVCVDPFVNQVLPETWPETDIFKPERFLDPRMKVKNKFAFIPFGGGIHRCIGESFAYVFVLTIMSHLIRKYEFELIDGIFPSTSYNSVVDLPSNSMIKYKLRKNV